LTEPARLEVLAMNVVVFQLESGRWTWDAADGGRVLAQGNDYDRPSRAAEAARKVTGREPVIESE
jgi:hypothetical protein